AVAEVLELESVVHGGEQDVAAGVVRRGLDERLQGRPRLVEAARGRMHVAEAVEDARVLRPQASRPREVVEGLVKAVLVLTEEAEEEVRLEVARIVLELAAEGGGGARTVARGEQRAAVQGVDGRQPRVERDRLVEL